MYAALGRIASELNQVSKKPKQRKPEFPESFGNGFPTLKREFPPKRPPIIPANILPPQMSPPMGGVSLAQMQSQLQASIGEPPEEKKVQPDNSNKKLQGYLHFVHERRLQLQESCPDWNELQKKISDEWKALSPEQKQEYYNLYQ